MTEKRFTKKYTFPQVRREKGGAVCTRRWSPGGRPLPEPPTAAGRPETGDGQTTGNCGTQSHGTGARDVPRYVSRAAFWQTIGNNGTQSFGGCGAGGDLRNPFGAMLVRLRLSKPRETVGLQSYGAYGMNRSFRFRYGSPTAGLFASEKCKERKLKT